MLEGATSGGAFTFPFHTMPLFSCHEIQGKLARCVSLIQRTSECHISTEIPGAREGIKRPSACKRTHVKILLQGEELLVKQQNTSNHHVSIQGCGESKKQAGKVKKTTEETSSCKVLHRTDTNTKAQTCPDWSDRSPKLRANSQTDGLHQLDCRRLAHCAGKQGRRV